MEKKDNALKIWITGGNKEWKKYTEERFEFFQGREDKVTGGWNPEMWKEGAE